MVTPKDTAKIAKDAKTSPTVVYGGPYANEADAITTESQKENPNYDELVKDWKTISSGAQAYIEQVQKPVEAPVGKFVSNVKEKKTDKVVVPEVIPFISPNEVVTDPDATNETVKETGAPAEEDKDDFGL